jgi:hypothetical protein
MNEPTTTATAPATPPPVPAGKGSSCLVRGLAVAGVLLVAVGVLLWWYHRPIRPVVLTPPELEVVEAKVAALQPPDEPLADPPLADAGGETITPEYQPGAREIVITERELNGLLNAHTNMGDQVVFQFVPGAVLARIETPLDENIPIIGGRKLRARAKFSVDTSADSPSLALDDLTLWGISIPNDWLGGIKGRNLLGEVLGAADGAGIPGLESVTLERGRLVLQLKE